MWRAPDGSIVQDNDQYRAANGTVYPGNWPKAQITGLLPVTPTAPGNTATQDATPNGAVFVVDHWEQAWTITTWTQAKIDAYNAALALAAADSAEVAAARADTAVQYLMTHTAAETSSYLQTNMTTLATAKNVIVSLALAVGAIGKQVLR